VQDVISKQFFFIVVEFTWHEPINSLLFFFDNWTTLFYLGLRKIREGFEVDFLFPILMTEHDYILGLVLISIDIIVHMFLIAHSQRFHILFIS
jgi:hypothetical protein